MPIDPERQQKAKEYARIRHCLWAFDLVLSAFALIAVLVLGLNVWLKQVVLAIAPNIWLSTFLYFATALVAYSALFFPVSY